MNCFECGYPLQAGMTCSECGCDNTRYTSVLNIETQSPGIFRRMHRGFRCVKIYAIWILAMQITSQLFGVVYTQLMTPGAWAWVMDIWSWAFTVTGFASTLLLFLAAWWIAPRHAPDGPLPSRLVTTVRVLVALSFCWIALPYVVLFLGVLEWPSGVKTLLENIMNFSGSSWLYLLNTIVLLVAMPIFVYLCVRSAVILKSPRARGWFRVGFFFTLAGIVLQLPSLFVQIVSQLNLIDYNVVRFLSPPYSVVLSWIGAVNLWVYLAFAAFMLMGSIRMSQHLRTLIPIQTPLHQEGGAA